MERVRDLICSRAFQLSAATLVGVSASGCWLLLMKHLDELKKEQVEKELQEQLDKARLEWNAEDKKNVVILHQWHRDRNNLSQSPFIVKLETFLRIAEIPYVSDFAHPCSPSTQKSPWVSLNGQELSDSQIILDTLSRKLGKDLNSHLSPKEKSVARGFRILLEDHFYWVLMVHRCTEDPLNLKHGPSGGLDRRQQDCRAQGLGRLVLGDVQKMGIEDLEAISSFLGSKSFVMGGEKPSELDCVLFGFVSVIVNIDQNGSLFKTLVEKRLTNLHQHMLRMRSKYFTDWHDLINGRASASLPQTPRTTTTKADKESEKSAPESSGNNAVTPQPATPGKHQKAPSAETPQKPAAAGKSPSHQNKAQSQPKTPQKQPPQRPPEPARTPAAANSTKRK